MESQNDQGGVVVGDVVQLDPLVTGGRSLLLDHKLKAGVHYDCYCRKKSETRFRKTCQRYSL